MIKVNSKTTLAILIVLVLTLLASGCGSSNDKAGKTEHPGAETEKVLKVGMSSPVRELNNSFLLVEQTLIAETLMIIDGNYKLQPALAASWKQLDDLNWEIQLEKGIKFHDGSELDAATVMAALEKALVANPRSQSLSRIDKMEAAGSHVLKITTDQVNYFLPEALARPDFYVLSANSYNESGELVHPYGTGPFFFSQWDQASGEVVVERFEDYRKGLAGVNKMQFVSVPDNNTRALALESGEIDFTFDLAYGEIDRLKNKPGVNIDLYPQQRIYRLELNLNEEPFNDLKVREAVNYAINREAIATSILRGSGQATFGPFLPDAPWHNQAVEARFAYDQEKARALLEEAGWTVNSKGIREKNGMPLAITLMTWGTRPALPPMAEAIQAQLKEIGIDVKIEIFEYGAIYDRVKTGSWDVVLATFQTNDPFGYLNNVYATEGSQNVGKYSNSQVDELLQKAMATKDTAKRVQIYQEIQDLVANDLPMLNVSHYVMVVGSRDYVKDFKFNPNAHALHTSMGITIKK